MDSLTAYDKVTLSASASNDATRIHRRLLSAIDALNDSASDGDFTTDDEAAAGEYMSPGTSADGLMGISIGHAQDVMKSPRTPALEKANALEQSRNYFLTDLESQDELREEPEEVESPTPEKTAESIPATGQLSHPISLSPSRSNRLPHQVGTRSSFSRSILASSQDGTRKRSSSGSNIIGNLRRFLPELSPSSTARVKENRERSPATQCDNHNAEASETSVNVEENDTDSRALTPIPSPRAPEISPLRSRTDFEDFNKSSSEESQEHPHLLRRATSDQSLYLRRTFTGASHFDDVDSYSNISDQANARFKAITDSLQDSSLKLPKLPNFNLTSLIPGHHEPAQNFTQEDMRTNTTSRSRSVSLPQKLTNNKADTKSHDKDHHPVLTDALSKLSGDMVIMGGYRGSVLRDAQPPHRQLWVPVKVGLNLRKVDLEVGLERDDELKMTEKIIPSGPLSHIGPIDICRRLIRKCSKCPNSTSKNLRVHDWGYDWRLSPHLLSDQLVQYLESLKCNQPNTPASERGALVVAHSLGGLIARHAVNRRPELFSGVVFAGTPHNCVNILGPLRNGDDVLFSSRVLTAQVNFTLRTSYALLPEDGRCFINKVTGERYDMDFFDIKTWEEYSLSPCINHPVPPMARVRQKSIVGSISGSIASYTPSLPVKRTSWFGGNNLSKTSSFANNIHANIDTISSPDSSPTQHAKDKIEDAKDEAEEVSRNVLASLTSPSSASDVSGSGENQQGIAGAAKSSVEPTMQSSNHHKSLGVGGTGIATACTIPKDKAYEYLTRTLKEVKAFKQELHHNPTHDANNAYPPMAIIFGKAVPTVYGARVSSRDAIRYTDAYDDLAFAAGDGVVLASAAQLPAGYRCVKGGRVVTERGHVGILGDLEGVGQCINAVVRARRKGVGLGLDPEPDAKRGVSST